MWKTIEKAREILRKDPWRRPELLVFLVCYALQQGASYLKAERIAGRALPDPDVVKKPIPMAAKAAPRKRDVVADLAQYKAEYEALLTQLSDDRFQDMMDRVILRGNETMTMDELKQFIAEDVKMQAEDPSWFTFPPAAEPTGPAAHGLFPVFEECPDEQGVIDLSKPDPYDTL